MNARSYRLVLGLICLLAFVGGSGSVAAAPPPDIVISQIYGGGGNVGATYKNDFIELFNRGTTSVNVTGWSVQYASAAGTSWTPTTLSGTIAPGQYYLVREAAGTGGTVDLSTPDATGNSDHDPSVMRAEFGGGDHHDHDR